MAAEPEPRPTITRVWAKNFRSIEHAELALGPLTVLVGPNASGKSNLLDILGFLSDTMRHGLASAITRRGGIDSIGRRSPTGRVLGPEMGFEYEVPEGVLTYEFALARRGQGEYRVKREFARLESTDPGVSPSEIELTGGRLTKPNLKRAFGWLADNQIEDKGLANFLAGIIKQLLERFGDQDLQLLSDEPLPTIRLLSFVIPLPDEVEVAVKVESASYYLLHNALEDASAWLSKVALYHLFPNSLRDPQKVADAHPLAPGGENLASTLRDMIQKGSDLFEDLKAYLDYAAPGIRDVRVSRAGSYYVVELKHERSGGNGRGSWFDLSYESDGTIRLLAILVALFQEPSPTLIGLAEPELAIHPGAMVALSENMQEAALRGQILVATHSPDLIDRLPLDSLRAVTAEGGSTKVGIIVEHQLKSVKQKLFSPGEIHSMEGLIPADAGE